MAEEKKTSGSSTTLIIVIVILAVITLGAATAVGSYFLSRKLDKTAKTSSVIPASATPSRSVKSQCTRVTAETTDWETFCSEKYGIGFRYPAGWRTFDTFDKYGGKNEPDILLKIGFTDPVRERELVVAECVNNDIVGWSNPTPTKAECEQKLSGLSAAERERLSKLLLPRNIYLNIYKIESGQDLSDWLIAKYRQSGTELQDYTPGKEVEIAGVKGLVSDIGCCSDYNLSYNFIKGNYLYQLGTNDKESDTGKGDNTFLQKVAQTVKLIE